MSLARFETLKCLLQCPSRRPRKPLFYLSVSDISSLYMNMWRRGKRCFGNPYIADLCMSSCMGLFCVVSCSRRRLGCARRGFCYLIHTLGMDIAFNISSAETGTCECSKGAATSLVSRKFWDNETTPPASY